MANHWLDNLAHTIPLNAYKRLTRRNLIGLCYHAVSDVPLPHMDYLIPYKSAAMFERDLEYIKAHYVPVGYEQLLAHKVRKPDKTVLVTFDDGYAECFSAARPLLMKHRIPAIFFLITDCINNRTMFYRNTVSLAIDTLRKLPAEEQTRALQAISRVEGVPLNSTAEFEAWIKPLKQAESKRLDRVCEALNLDVEAYLQTQQPYLTAEQIKTMAAEGFVFGAHSRSHGHMADLDRKAAEDEIAGSCQAVRDLTGQEKVPFAFPFSANRVNREFLAGVLERHPDIYPLFDTKGIQKDKPFVYSRVAVDATEGATASRSNLPLLLHTAYQNNFKVFMARLGIHP